MRVHRQASKFVSRKLPLLAVLMSASALTPAFGSDVGAGCNQKGSTLTCTGAVSDITPDYGTVTTLEVYGLTQNITRESGFAIVIRAEGDDGSGDGDSGEDGRALSGTITLDSSYGIDADEGIYFNASGGSGHDGKEDKSIDPAHSTTGETGGAGGNGNDVVLTIQSTSSSVVPYNIKVSDLAIDVHSEGGDGGTGGKAHSDSLTNAHGGYGGDGGDGGAITVKLNDGAYVYQSTADDQAIYLISLGGDGGEAGEGSSGGKGEGGKGGTGGAGGDITLSATGKNTISTEGDGLAGVFVLSTGGAGGEGGEGAGSEGRGRRWWAWRQWRRHQCLSVWRDQDSRK